MMFKVFKFIVLALTVAIGQKIIANPFDLYQNIQIENHPIMNLVSDFNKGDSKLSFSGKPNTASPLELKSLFSNTHRDASDKFFKSKDRARIYYVFVTNSNISSDRDIIKLMAILSYSLNPIQIYSKNEQIYFQIPGYNLNMQSCITKIKQDHSLDLDDVYYSYAATFPAQLNTFKYSFNHRGVSSEFIISQMKEFMHFSQDHNQDST